MSIFSFRRRRTLKPAWSYIAPGLVWRLLLSTSGICVGETRDQHKKEVSFFALNALSGEVLWANRVFDELWWIGIEAVTKDVLLLHTYAQPDRPEHKGILAVELATGKRMWTQSDVTYWFSHEEKIYAYRTLFERRVGCEFDVQTGELLCEYDEDLDTLMSLRRSALSESSQDGFLFPQLAVASEEDPRIASCIQKKVSHVLLQGDVEYVRLGDLLLFNYHRQSDTKSQKELLLENHFHIVDLKNGGNLFSDVLSSNSRAPVPDSFFVKDGTAYFVKDQTTLTAIPLTV